MRRMDVYRAIGVMGQLVRGESDGVMGRGVAGW